MAYGDTFIVGDYEYEITSMPEWSPTNRGEVNVRVVSTSKSSYSNIPSSVTYDGGVYLVTSMNDCFTGCSNIIASPSIPNTVTQMIASFSNCVRLQTAPAIPSGVLSMEYCFDSCENLTTPPSIPNGVTDMRNCFYGCLKLRTAPTIPSSVESLYGCFGRCQSITSPPVIKGSNLIQMEHCFSGCTSLVSPPVIPNSVEQIEGCFANCINLESAPSLPNGLNGWLNALFMNCKKLTTPPEMPAYSSIMSRCFLGCSNLTSAPSIPDSAYYLDECFSGCSSLVSAPKIPNGVMIMTSCFDGCDSLKGNVYVSNNPSHYENVFSNTSNDIYIIPENLDDSAAATWRTIAAQRDNVHYYTDDILLEIERLDGFRVASTLSDERDDSGMYGLFYMLVSLRYIPEVQIEYSVVTEDFVNNVDVHPAKNWEQVDSYEEDGYFSLRRAWFDIGKDYGRLAVRVSDNYGNAPVAMYTLNPIYALLDLHKGGDGMTFGGESSGNGFEVFMDADIDGGIYVSDEQSLSTFVYDSVPPEETADSHPTPGADPSVVVSRKTGSAYLYRDGNYTRLGA